MEGFVLTPWALAEASRLKARSSVWVFGLAALVCATQAQSADITTTTDPLAANDSQQVNELQAEIDQLRKENEALKAALPGAAPQASSVPAAVEEKSAQAATEPAEANTLDAVVIKGRHHSELEQVRDVPKSVSLVTGAELEKLNTDNFRDIVTRVGNLGMSNANPQAGSLYIRGLGWSTGVGPLDPSVGVTVDGVSLAINALAASLDFYDIDTFDVTHGPQGTLGGKNSSVGTVTINTKRPTFKPEAEGSLTYGQLNTLDTKAFFSGPVINDLLAFRFTFLRRQADGPYKNANDPNFSYKNTDRTYGRAQFLLAPNPNFSALLSLEFTPTEHEISDNYVYFNRPTPAFYDSIDPNTGNPIAVNPANTDAVKLTRPWFTREPNYSFSGNFLANQINRLSQQTNSYGTHGAQANLTWNLSGYTLQSISAYKQFNFDSGGGPISVFDINRSPSTGHVEYSQGSQELKLISPIGGFVDYQTGLYFIENRIPNRWSVARYGSDAGAYYATASQYTHLDADAPGRTLLSDSLTGLYTRSNDFTTNTSTAWYGSANWHITQPFTLTTGLRLTQEARHDLSQSLIIDEGYGSSLDPASVNNVQVNATAQSTLLDSVALHYFGVASYSALNATQKQQVTDAKAIRLARIGTLYQPTTAQPYNKLLPTLTISPSYKINEDQTGYLTYQHGEKAGIAQVVGATVSGGKSAPVAAEKTNAYEVGIKSSLLDRTLTVNADVYLQNVSNYIQSIYYYDAAQTAANNNGLLAYTAGLGGVPKVQAKGLEVDATYSGIQYTTFRFSGAYNDARYKDFKFLAKPAELGGTTTPYYDATGKTLPGAAKFTGNLFGEYQRPVFIDKVFHANFNYHYSTSYNVDTSLSRYAVVRPYGLTDVAIGLGRLDGIFDFSVIAKNVLNVDTGYNLTWNTYAPTVPRWLGVTISSKFY